jgi:ABC-type glycerol-3-phosphate transport system substrate-binding protein
LFRLFAAVVLLFLGCEKESVEIPVVEPTFEEVVKTNIRIFIESKSDEGILKDIISVYESENPNKTVEIVCPEDFSASVNESVTAHNIPELVFCKLDSPEINEYISNGELIEPFLVTASYHGIIINEDLFERHGFAPPATAAELSALCDAIREKELYAFGSYTSPTDKFVKSHITLFGAPSGPPGDEAISKAAELLKIIYNNVDYSIVNLGYEQNLNEFASERSFMILGDSEDVLTARYINPSLRMSIIPVPGYEISTEILKGFAIFSQSNKQDDARNFLEFFKRPIAADLYADKTGAVRVDGEISGARFTFDYSQDYVKNLRVAILTFLNDRNETSLINNVKNIN